MQPAGNYYDKYGTKNPIARELMRNFLGSFEDLLARCDQDQTALEVGCGEGELSIRVALSGKRVSGFDIAPAVLPEAERRSAAAGVSLNLRTDSIFNLDPERDAADLVVCCEVMEHLEEPAVALQKLHSVCRKHLIVSVPREPIWRVLNLARGKYITDLGNTPGHLQHWSKTAFLQLLQTRFDVQEVRLPLPWTMALCSPRD
jgi:2-polyprenyl-3-methyl-5-hydroxy-6-metoxy-1,4-benzoquinol methylase